MLDSLVDTTTSKNSAGWWGFTPTTP